MSLAYAVSGAGDVNGDGFDDLLIGALGVSTNDFFAGAAYVVFGGTNVGSGGTVNLGSLSAPDGFVLNGAAAGDVTGSGGERGGGCKRRWL